MNGSAYLGTHGGRRLTVPGVGLVELISDADGNVTDVVTTEPLSPEQHQRLMQWLEQDWSERGSGVFG